jgi:hypothetical protein
MRSIALPQAAIALSFLVPLYSLTAETSHVHEFTVA